MPEMNISTKTKQELFNELIKDSNLFGGNYNAHQTLAFISEVWNIHDMPSEDSRFDNAYKDIYQHTINNDDWDTNELFVRRLQLFRDDDIFIKFLESIVHPEYRVDESDIIKYVLTINAFIEKEGVQLALDDYENDKPIYKVRKIDGSPPQDINLNKIPFFVKEKLKNGISVDDINGHSTPSKFPSFVLVYYDWDDYDNKTRFCLFYYKNQDEYYYIGETKITNGKDFKTTDVLPNTFNNLDDSFCSLGQEYSFYEKLKKHLDLNFESVLYALRDAGFFPDINDEFEHNRIFRKSLIRFDEPERLLRKAKYRIYGYDLTDLYSFKYYFQPKYSNDGVDISFDFNNKSEVFNRIYAIIGENGVGKTQLITSLPLDISQKKDKYFVPRAPLFSKVIAVSYSVFDNFEIPKRTSQFNYVYCGLLDENRKLLDEESRRLKFHDACEKIVKSDRIEQYRDILVNFLDEALVDYFIDYDDNGQYKLDSSKLKKVRSQLSSGQSIILHIISEIVSQIRLDSLILFDEPETHLHPNAMSQLINTIFTLVDKFESYCIITTHSPLIIQELFSNNVYVMERHEDIPSLRNISLESFGENLSVLTDEVFGNKEIPKQYKKIIDRLVNRYSKYEQVVDELTKNGNILSLNTRLYIRSKFSE